MAKTTWGECPVCRDRGERDVKCEHTIEGHSGFLLHHYYCPQCGEHTALVVDKCPDCPKPGRE